MGLHERRIKEKDNRKKLILKSARTLFFKKGFNKVTVDEIAKISELGKGSIYLYFNSKEEIYAQILLNDIDNFYQIASVLFEKKGSALELLEEFSTIYVDFFLNEGELFRILMTFMLHPDRMNLSKELNARILEANARSIDIIGKILEKGVESGEFSPQINIRQNQNAIWGLLNGVVSLFIFFGSKERRKDKINATIKSALEVFVKGLK
ncbi:MAG TPA: TetR/AcrR family transcriptional regulator [Smithella sp.]|nr:TetR/AcrR family transcriptional regulator [Smithella sp.]